MIQNMIIGPAFSHVTAHVGSQSSHRQRHRHRRPTTKGTPT